MSLVMIAVVLGFVVRQALARSSCPNPSSAASLCYGWVPVSALALQARLSSRLPPESRSFVTNCTTAAVIAWLLVNAYQSSAGSRRVALLVIACGAALNLAPILQLGAMPVDRAALTAAGYPADYDVTSGHLSKHVAVAHEDVSLLGDRFAIPPLRTVASIGDFVELAGIGLLISTHPKRRGTIVSRSSYAAG